MKLRRILSLLICLTLALSSVMVVSAAEGTPNVTVPGAVSGILKVSDGYMITDVSNKLIWKMDSAGNYVQRIGLLAATGADGEPVGAYHDGLYTTAQFMEPWDIAPYLDGYIVSDAEANVLRYVANNLVITAAGSGKAGAKDGKGKAVEFSRPTGLAADGKGGVYAADTNNGLIRYIDKSGNVKTVVKDLVEPTGLFFKNGTLYIAETGRNRILSFKDSKVEVILGPAKGASTEAAKPGFIDGSKAVARLSAPCGVAVGDDGTIYIADTGNSAVRMLKDGKVTTILQKKDNSTAPTRPRSIAFAGNCILVTDVFARQIISITLTFDDVAAGAWYSNAVKTVSGHGLITGTGKTIFSPQASLTRGMLVTILSRFRQIQDKNAVIYGESSFSDVAEGAWYETAVKWAADNDIAKGNGGLFAPNDNVTRQDIVTLLYRYAQAFGLNTSKKASLNSYSDAGLVSEYARPAMEWALGSGIMKGASATTLNPRGTATRAEAAQLFTGLLTYAGL